MKNFSRTNFLVTATAFQFAIVSASADDQEMIQGVWKGTLPGEQFGDIELTITADKISGRNLTSGRTLGEGTYKSDPTKRLIEAHGIEGPFSKKTYLGLYSLEGNTLKWVSNGRLKNRPVDLVHRPDKDQFLMVLERR